MYLPKIKFSKLTAKPGEFIDKLGKPVFGSIIKSFTGKVYKGSSPQGIKEEDELIRVEKATPADKKFVSRPNRPTFKNYKKGSFFRYFIKDSRNGLIIEVTREDFREEKAAKKLYRRVLKLEWYITGDAEDKLIGQYLYPGLKSKNQDVVNQAERQMPGIAEQILKDTSQFVLTNAEVNSLPRPKKVQVKEDLFTNGGEYINRRTREDYVGFYHIHPSKGAMAGKKHVEEYHDRLKPVKKAFKPSPQADPEPVKLPTLEIPKTTRPEPKKQPTPAPRPTRTPRAVPRRPDNWKNSQMRDMY